MVLDFAKEAIDNINNNWIEQEGIKAWGTYSNYSNRKKSCTITKEDIEKFNSLNDSAQDLINEVDLIGDLL